MTSLERIRNAYQERLQLSEDDRLIFDFVVSTLTATVCEILTEPVWTYVIAPPGACKTESVKPFQGMEEVVFISSLTDNWLMSGYRDDDGTDPSLITTLDKKVLIVKDISSLTNLPPRTVNKVFGDLRDAYDGSASKASGVSGLTEYVATFGAIMLGTGAIDSFAEEHQQLGERFLSFRMHRKPLTLVERQALALHVSKSMKDKKAWQSDLKSLVQEELKKIFDRARKITLLPTASDDTIYDVMLMGNLLSLLRTTPIRGMTESPELPTRIGQQLMNLGTAHAIADGRDEWNEDDLHLVRRVAIDTLPAFRSRLIRTLWERGRYRPLTPVSTIMGRCETTRKEAVESILAQYAYSKLIEGDEHGESFRLTEEMFNALEKVQIL